MNQNSRRRWVEMRWISVLGLLAVSWSTMTVTHEVGHLLGGWCGGGVLQFVELRPWKLPSSHFDPDPFPRMTLWCGPILGIGIPLGFWFLFRSRTLEFIAAFCLLANGTYLAAAAIAPDPFLDTTRLLQHGASPLSITLFCLLTIVPGYLWFRRVLLRAITPPQPPKAPASVRL